MKFEDTGLKSDPLVKEAFQYAYDYNQSLKPEVEASLNNQLNLQLESRMEYLNAMKDAGKMTEEQFNATKDKLEKSVERMRESVPKIAERQVNEMFNAAKLAPVLELQQYSENSSPSLLAAAMLISCVRDPLDCHKVEEKFGPAVAGLIAEVMHIDAYPAMHDANIAAASADAKRILLSEMTAELGAAPAQLSKQIAAIKAQVGEDAPIEMSFPAKEVFTSAKALWGNDKKLDARLVATFNAVADVTNSDFRMEVSPEGKLELAAGAKKAPPVPKGPKGPTISGDDGF